MPERFATSAIRSIGKPSSSSVCSARRMFFIDGTSGVETSSSWSLRSSAVSIGPSKSGAVSTTIASYIPRAVWRMPAIRVGVDGLALLGPERRGQDRQARSRAARRSRGASRRRGRPPLRSGRAASSSGRSRPSTMPTSPNCTSRSTSSVRSRVSASPTARLTAIDVLPVPPLVEETMITRDGLRLAARRGRAPPCAARTRSRRPAAAGSGCR